MKNNLGQFLPVDIVERFLAKIKKTNTCWLWMGWKDGKGYGKLQSHGSYVMAHRFSYEHFKTTISPGLTIDHICRNPGCVNPDHLEAVTKKVNILRGISPSAIHGRMKVCKNGHEFDQVRPSGRRACSRCRHNYYKAYRGKNLAYFRSIGK